MVERAARVQPDASAPRSSKAYRSAVAQDLIGRGINPAEVAVRLLLETSYPGASLVRGQADAVADQGRARALERERLAREVRDRDERGRER